MSEPLILLVEDNPADVLVIKMALTRVNSALRVQELDDGQAALDYLSGRPPFTDRNRFPLPSLMLLDLGLPHVDGFHVLEWVRTEPVVQWLPIVILATTSSLADIQRAYQFGANSFITKPADLEKLVRDLETAFQHWLKIPASDSILSHQSSTVLPDVA